MLTVVDVVLGVSQIGGTSTPVSFLQNYASASDAQHFRVLNNGQQVQLVLDEYSGSQLLPKCVSVLMMSSSWLWLPVLRLGYGWAVEERHNLEATA